MAKRAKTAKTAKKRNTSALAKAAKRVPALPVIARAASAIPATAIVLAVGACAVGVLAVLLFGGPSGQRRRELIRDKALQAGRDVSETLSKGRHRLESVAMEATKRVRGELSDGVANGRSDRAEPAMNI
jgi:hypothetical protein